MAEHERRVVVERSKTKKLEERLKQVYLSQQYLAYRLTFVIIG